LGEIGDPSKLIIIGDVGQGKSMLMRYLAATEFQRGDRFPVFIELRKLRGQRIIDAILRQFHNLGITLTEQEFHTVASQKQVLAFFDGYDEVHPDRRSDILSELEDLCQPSIGLRVVISTRPGTNVEMSPHFTVHRIAPLSDNDILEYAARTLRHMTHVRSAMEVSQINISAQAVTEDIIECTGLIIEVDGEYEFAHRQLLEFHGAACIADMAPDSKTQAYTDLVANPDHQAIRFLRVLDPADFKLLFELPFWMTHLDQSLPDDAWSGVRLFRQDMYYIQKKSNGSLFAWNNALSIPRFIYEIIIGGWNGGRFWKEDETRELLNFQSIQRKWDSIPSDLHSDVKWVRLDYLAQEQLLTSSCRERYRSMRMAIDVRVAEIKIEFGIV
jgi:hypothetical protein